MKNKMKSMLERKLMKACLAVQNFAKDESGLTIVEIMIILGIVIGLAVALQTLGGEVSNTIGDIVRDFLDSLG